jgi:V/A-type H+/Na+-transporting ATPase subunit F
VNFFCIADEDTVRGFRLAGVGGKVVTTPEEAGAALSQAAAQANLGIVILTQQVAAGIRRLVDDFRLERDRPLLVEIPGPEGSATDGNSLRQVVRSAVGISLDNQGS